MNRKTGGGQECKVHTFFDDDAKVWVAESPIGHQRFPVDSTIDHPIKVIFVMEGEPQMIVKHDDEVDAVYLQLSDAVPDGVVEATEGVNLDTSSDGDTWHPIYRSGSDRFRSHRHPDDHRAGQTLR